MCWSLQHTLFPAVIKKIILLLPLVSQCCCKSNLPSWPTYQAFFHFSCNPPMVLAHQLLPSALNELSPSFCKGILYQIPTHTFNMSLHQLQHLLHCQVRTLKDFPDYKVLSVNISSKAKKKPKQNCCKSTLDTRLLTFCT